MLSELTGEQKLNSGLDRPGRHGPPSGDSDEVGGFTTEAFESVVHQGVHHAHGTLGDADLWVDLLEYLVDVERVGLVPLSSAWGGGAGFSSSGHFYNA